MLVKFAAAQPAVPQDSILSNISSFDEAPVRINADKAGSFILNCFIKGKTIYVPAAELFSNLKINFRLSESCTDISGFFIEENSVYEINAASKTAVIKDKKYSLSPDDAVLNGSDVFFSPSVFENIFGIRLDADFSRLEIYLTSKNKLPVVAELERNLLRGRNMFEQTGVKDVDLFIPRKRKLLGLGVLDWNLNYAHSSPASDRYYYNLSHGSEIFGGDFIARINGDDKNAFDKNNAEWRWRFVDDRKWFKQAIAGNMRLQSGLLGNTQGFQITNSPPVSRRTIGSYKIFDRTGSKWDVELYINNELIAYTKSDDNGYFEFNVPLLYGSNYITLKYYGNSGEIRTEERVIQVPFNFLPEKTVEYNVSGGTLKTENHNLFTESNVNWGITKAVTSGAGLLYFNEPGINKFYPYANTSARFLEKLIFSADYFHNLKGSANISLLLPSQIYMTASYIRYGRNEYFNRFNYREEENISSFVPLVFKSVSLSVRMNFRNVVSDNYKLLFLNSGVFVNYRRFQGSVVTNASWSKTSETYDDAGSRSSLNLSYRILSDMLVRQQTEIDHASGRFSNAGIYIDKGVFGAGWLTVFAFRDFMNNDYSGGLTFRFDLSFGRYNAGYSGAGTGWDFQQSLYGSVGYDQFRKSLFFDNQNMVSRGGLSLVPFLDMNGNGYPDENEKILNTEFDSRINAGKLIKSNGEYRYTDLDPYASYRLELSPVSFDNPLYRPKYKTFGVEVDPNRFKVVPVPVYAAGIINGSVGISGEQAGKHVSMLKILLESVDGKIKMETRTFSDGEFIFDNVPPGKYRIYPSPDELNGRSLETTDEIKFVEIKQSEDGDTIDNVSFTFTKKR
ncbi:MAG: carboxypeptidase-like regulatory domain-containing protein [Bacteroidetes bacterium]|nr:carboxypeptidase-like regulatory domain-containing protein [Bacteroidota bacterium]